MPLPLPSTSARRGFSLVELLVVLAIIATMAGLVLGGLFRTRDSNRLLAAEQILADAIRQGRHTARSTGSPVELRLTPTLSGTDVVGAKLSGVTRVCLWSETFDKERDDPLRSLPLPEPNEAANGVVVGRSGNGRMPSKEYPIPAQRLENGTTLVRGGRTDGFQIGCSVLPPTHVTDGAIIPLLMVGTAVARVEESQCALFLFGVNLQERLPTPVFNPGQIPAWELIGAVWDASGTEVSISSHLHQLTTRMANPDLPSRYPDLTHAIVGGQWIDVSLLYDGKRMLLYLNGERIAELRTGVPAALKAEGDFVHVGMIQEQSKPLPTYAGGTRLDDVRLYRLGSGDISELPGNVVLISADGGKPDPDLKYRILCQPDGRVEVSRDVNPDGDLRALNDRVTIYENFEPAPPPARPGTKRLKPRIGDTATITLSQLRSPGTIQSAQLTVTLDGHVSSRLITQPLAASGSQ